MNITCQLCKIHLGDVCSVPVLILYVQGTCILIKLKMIR